MLVCEVVGNIIATRKNDKLKGCTFLLVDSTEGQFVAVDNIGAGIGEKVLVSCGSAARRAFTQDINGTSCDYPVDAAVVGIVDEQ